VVVWRLDRLGRKLRHLITLLEELQALGIAFVSLNEGIDATIPAGKLQMHILGAIAEFERARIQERVRAGLSRARWQGHASAGRGVASTRNGSPSWLAYTPRGRATSGRPSLHPATAPGPKTRRTDRLKSQQIGLL